MNAKEWIEHLRKEKSLLSSPDSPPSPIQEAERTFGELPRFPAIPATDSYNCLGWTIFFLSGDEAGSRKIKFDAWGEQRCLVGIAGKGSYAGVHRHRGDYACRIVTWFVPGITVFGLN